MYRSTITLKMYRNTNKKRNMINKQEKNTNTHNIITVSIYIFHIMRNQ